MKGFGINVKNDLLEPKHVESMDAAVWLYLWLLDKMTSVSERGVGKVLGGQPIVYVQVALELGTTERTYNRWVARLRKGGYINTVRTPRGLVFTINKAVKIFGSSPKRDTPKVAEQVHSDPPKSVEGSAKSGIVIRQKRGSNIRQYKDNTKTTITNVIGASPVEEFGDPKINQLIEHFEKRVGKMTRMKMQRRAASILIKQYGFERVIGGINAVAACRDERYAPMISNLEELREKWVNLETFYQRLTKTKSKVTRIN